VVPCRAPEGRRDAKVQDLWGLAGPEARAEQATRAGGPSGV
jgi:hypothetical protein